MNDAVYKYDDLNLDQLLNKELRHVETFRLLKLSCVLDRAEGWKKLLEVLTKPQDDPNHNVAPHRLHLPLDAIYLIEQQLHCGKSCTMALLNHWAITGRRRPTVKTLLYCLHACNMNWAKDQVYRHILDINPEILNELLMKQPTPNYLSCNETTTHQIGQEYEFDHLHELVDSLETKCSRYSFDKIYQSTNQFCHQPFDVKTGRGFKIGEGRFSSVFRALSYPSEAIDAQQVVAAKLLKSACDKKYLVNEVNLMHKIRQENILELLGVSLSDRYAAGSAYICLIYPYMPNGSLLDCIDTGIPTREGEFLSWQERLKIIVKVARGICYLHSFETTPIIHRDIKSANILIDTDLQPKIGDFTLVRQLELSQNSQYSENVIGTCVYMPPEAFRGDISTKFDTFSYGVILLELLTGLKPFDEELGEDILTHIKDKLSDIEDELSAITQPIGGGSENLEKKSKDKFLSEILDKKAGSWNFEKSRSIFDISLASTSETKRSRPELTSILPDIEALLIGINI